METVPAVDELSKICKSHGRRRQNLLSRLGGSALESSWLEFLQAVAAFIGDICQGKSNCSSNSEKLLIACLMHGSRPGRCSSKLHLYYLIDK